MDWTLLPVLHQLVSLLYVLSFRVVHSVVYRDLSLLWLLAEEVVHRGTPLLHCKLVYLRVGKFLRFIPTKLLGALYDLRLSLPLLLLLKHPLLQ